MLSGRFLTQLLYTQIYHATSKHKSWYNFLVRFSYKSCQENFRHIEGKRKNWKRKKITTLMERKRKNKKWKEKINTCNVNHMEVGEKKSRLTWVRGVSRHVETGLRRARTARRAPRSVLTRDRHNGIAPATTPPWPIGPTCFILLSFPGSACFHRLPASHF